MSTLIVPMVTIDKVEQHPNADKLDIAQVLGFQVVIPKETYKAGDKVLYVPPDSVLPFELSELWGVTKYLSNGRVRAVRLRGEPSFGFIQTLKEDFPVGVNLCDFYGITKWVSPFKPQAGDVEVPHPLFFEYTEIEDLRHFPDILQEGEHVAVTEKLHGANTRVGIIEGVLMAGSHKQRRKQPEDFNQSVYWFPFTVHGVRQLFEDFSIDHKQVILFGEVFGKGIQNLHYGQDRVAFRAFDLLVDGKYVDYEKLVELADVYGFELVPTLGVLPYNFDEIAKLSKGNSVIGGNHIREGVVVKPLKERTNPKVGRVILKLKSDAYLTGKYSEQEVADV